MEGRTGSTAIGVLVLAIVIGHAVTLRDGHAWVGDDIQYVLHARNILSGVAYADIGYVYNPGGRIPPSYPPVFPVAIAPLVAAFGASWTALKLFSVACFGISLLLIARLARDRLPFAGRAGLIVLLGVNPVLWQFKDYVLSENLFVLLCLSTFVVDVARRDAKPGASGVWLDVSVGALAYLCYGTRAVGALVIASVVLATLWRERRITRSAWLPIAIFVPFALAQNLLVHSEASHAAYKLGALSGSLILSNALVVYPQILASFWDPAMGTIVMLLIGAVSLALAGAGFVDALRTRGPSAPDLFTLGYAGFFLSISHHDVEPIQRYLIPLFPFYALYVVLGLGWLGGRARGRGTRVAIATYALLLLASLLGLYQVPRQPFINGASGASARALYDFVEARMDSDDVLVFFEPRALVFYTGRPSTQFTAGATAAEHEAFVREVGARYWVDTGELPRFLGRRLPPLFDNGEFQVYTIDALFPGSAGG